MDTNQVLMELWKRQSDGNEKYCYFLLAAAASAIAFVVGKTEGQKFSWWILPAGLAAISWLLSFYCGCQQLRWSSAATQANYGLLQLLSGTHPLQPNNQKEAVFADQTIRKTLQSHIDRAHSFYKWQFRLLIAGGVLLLLWRVLEMSRN